MKKGGCLESLSGCLSCLVIVFIGLMVTVILLAGVFTEGIPK